MTVRYWPASKAKPEVSGFTGSNLDRVGPRESGLGPGSGSGLGPGQGEGEGEGQGEGEGEGQG